ncbi:hypothetical protein HPB50_004545 [Hyalomma asiaticum]|uniref:Uncharacterized protein n=1 Tax=Hyalomma asiaticum TaxID=266040 RepID=A0ACB7S0B0_HYAAI|nr:hypothetical protein HPB50_004545 [Hyalomma asiaticum]
MSSTPASHDRRTLRLNVRHESAPTPWDSLVIQGLFMQSTYLVSMRMLRCPYEQVVIIEVVKLTYRNIMSERKLSNDPAALIYDVMKMQKYCVFSVYELRSRTALVYLSCWPIFLSTLRATSSIRDGNGLIPIEATSAEVDA